MTELSYFCQGNVYYSINASPSSPTTGSPSMIPTSLKPSTSNPTSLPTASPNVSPTSSPGNFQTESPSNRPSYAFDFLPIGWCLLRLHHTAPRYRSSCSLGRCRLFMLAWIVEKHLSWVASWVTPPPLHIRALVMFQSILAIAILLFTVSPPSLVKGHNWDC